MTIKVSLGKYRVRQVNSHKVKFIVYNLLDNETIANFLTREKAQSYANKLNGEE